MAFEVLGLFPFVSAVGAFIVPGEIGKRKSEEQDS